MVDVVALHERERGELGRVRELGQVEVGRVEGGFFGDEDGGGGVDAPEERDGLAPGVLVEEELELEAPEEVLFGVGHGGQSSDRERWGGVW